MKMFPGFIAIFVVVTIAMHFVGTPVQFFGCCFITVLFATIGGIYAFGEPLPVKKVSKDDIRERALRSHAYFVRRNS